MVTPTIKISLLVLIASLFFTSCVEPIEFDPGDVSPYPVLVSRPCGDSTVSVYISKSRFFLANSSNVHALDDATVTLIVNGVPSAGVYDEGACNGYGGYLFPLLPRPGDSLRIGRWCRVLATRLATLPPFRSSLRLRLSIVWSIQMSKKTGAT